MDIKTFGPKLKDAFSKYKYAGIILLIGLVLLLIPGKSTEKVQISTPKEIRQQEIETDALVQILETIQGAGEVKVLLSTASGAETVYQTDCDSSADTGSVKQNTVVVTDSQRNETGLVRQVKSPVYLGAVVVCEGADSPTVKLAVTQAVSRVTGLGSDSICVLKMK